LLQFCDEAGAVGEIGQDVIAGGAGVVLGEVVFDALLAVDFGAVGAHLGVFVVVSAE
jgi:hypothetical protein